MEGLLYGCVGQIGFLEVSHRWDIASVSMGFNDRVKA